MRIAAAIVLFFLLALAGTESRAASYIVRMSNYQFTPATIDVDVGDSITWSNTVFTGHDTFCDGVWWSGEQLLSRGQTFKFTFNVAPGNYDYVCTPHISFGMVGTVRVHAAVPPTVNIVSPANQASFLEGETINVSVQASDAAGLSKVELLVENVSVQTKTTAPFDFSLTLPAGAHTLVARATNTKGASANSAPVSISVVSPNQPPVVSLISLSDGAVFTAPADVVLEATAVHPTGIQRVEFYADGLFLGSVSTAPYRLVHTFSIAKSYVILATAVAVSGATGNASATIVVNDAIPSAPQITLLTPTNGSFVTLVSNVLLAAQAVDLDGSIANVKFFEGTNLLGAVATPAVSNRFELLTELPEGVHTIFAIATDNIGITSTSAPPTSFALMLRADITVSNLIGSNVLRLGFFGTSGFPYVFEYSTDMETWIPFKTNQLYRRILFFDVPTITNEHRFYRARPPENAAGGTFSDAALDYLRLKLSETNGGAPPVPTL